MKQDLELSNFSKYSIDDQGNITKLSLVNSRLIFIPDHLFELTELYRLSLLNNKLETLSSSIGNLA